MRGVHSGEGWPRALLHTSDPSTSPVCAPVSLYRVLRKPWLLRQVQFCPQSSPSSGVTTQCRSPFSCVESVSRCLVELSRLFRGRPLFGVQTGGANFVLRNSCGIGC